MHGKRLRRFLSVGIGYVSAKKMGSIILLKHAAKVCTSELQCLSMVATVILDAEEVEDTEDMLEG